jgi:hypothetical protein
MLTLASGTLARVAFLSHTAIAVAADGLTVGLNGPAHMRHLGEADEPAQLFSRPRHLIEETYLEGEATGRADEREHPSGCPRDDEARRRPAPAAR